MSYKRVLIVSDNDQLLNFLSGFIGHRADLSAKCAFTFASSPQSPLLGERFGSYKIEPVDMKKQAKEIIEKYDLVISVHSKQIFPDELVRKVKCINIHPGYNPYNRGWYPQVFSILNGLPLGATIHEIDFELDHGKIICQKKVPLKTSDTSLDSYNRVIEAEKVLISENLEKVLDGNYQSEEPSETGNINLKKDFESLRKINLEDQATYREVIDRLRALTHPPYKNAYFVDEKTGNRIWINISLEEE